jgi:hypothetical protein
VSSRYGVVLRLRSNGRWSFGQTTAAGEVVREEGENYEVVFNGNSLPFDLSLFSGGRDTVHSAKGELHGAEAGFLKLVFDGEPIVWLRGEN